MRVLFYVILSCITKFIFSDLLIYIYSPGSSSPNYSLYYQANALAYAALALLYLSLSSHRLATCDTPKTLLLLGLMAGLMGIININCIDPNLYWLLKPYIWEGYFNFYNVYIAVEIFAIGLITKNYIKTRPAE